MTDINFYVSKHEGSQFRLAIVYRLVSLAMERDLSIHIHTDNDKSSQLIDDYLWTKDKTSFIPHSICSESSNNKALGINISHTHEPLENCDYLINFSSQRPSFFSRFLKVAEILDTSEEILTAGRKRYAFYRDRGYTLKYHQL